MRHSRFAQSIRFSLTTALLGVAASALLVAACIGELPQIASVGDGGGVDGGCVGAACDDAAPSDAKADVLPPHCTDGVVSADETDTDCGGNDCNRCDNTKSCKSASDCASGACTSGKCAMWSRSFGGVGIDRLFGQVVDAAGNIYLVGLFNGPTDLGGDAGTQVPVGLDGFVMKLLRDGRTDWVKTISGNGDQYFTGVVLASNGDVIVGGTFVATGTSLKGDVIGPGTMLTRLTPAGTVVWERSYANGYLGPVAIDSSDDFVAAGYKDGSNDVTFGTTLLTARGGGYDGLAAKFRGSDGAMLWAANLGGPDVDTTMGSQLDHTAGVGLAPNGDMYVTGSFLNGKPPVGISANDAAPPNSGWDPYVARLSSADGGIVWGKAFFGSSFVDVLNGVLPLPNGDLIVTATGNSMDFGLGPGRLEQHPTLVRLPSDGGPAQWQNEVVLPDDKLMLAQLAGPATMDPAGRLLIAGDFYGPEAAFRGATLDAASTAGSTGYLIVVDPANGNVLKARTWGGTGMLYPYRTSVTPGTGNVVISGVFTGSVDLGAGTHVGHPPPGDAGTEKEDFFVMSLGRAP